MERYHIQTIQSLRGELAEIKEQNRLLRNGSVDDGQGNNESGGDAKNIKDVQECNVTDPVAGNANKVPEGVNATSKQVILRL